VKVEGDPDLFRGKFIEFFGNNWMWETRRESERLKSENCSGKVSMTFESESRKSNGKMQEKL
jgi:hypothetical protein